MIKPNKCKKTSFLAIFQPMAPLNKRTEDLINFVRTDLNKNKIYDISNLREKLNFIDHTHVDQKSREIIADKIFPLIKKVLVNKEIC